MPLIFTKIENSSIFSSDFSPFTHNNQIDFSTREAIAVIYGPNGTGKTSLIKALSDAPNTTIEYEYDGNHYTSGMNIFHIINDQNYRNIIAGETKDFFLGDNIQREFELENMLAEKRRNLISDIINIIKNLGITSAKSLLIEYIINGRIKAFVKDCANGKSKGERFSTQDIMDIFSPQEVIIIPEYDQRKLKFFMDDLCRKEPIILTIEKLVGETIAPNTHVREIEENNEAISILSRFQKTQCIVCDTTGIDWERLLREKTENRDVVQATLEPHIRALLEELTAISFTEDPFFIKSYVLRTLEEGNVNIILPVLREISDYKNIYESILKNALLEAFEQSDILSVYNEYQRLHQATPDITDEDFLLLSEIIINNMSKPLTIERDDKRRLRIKLSDQEFLGKKREELPLSTGEQNFLSLTFEFLKAKNSTAPIVVIDDPVSSFDSIYKNKVAYAIVKMLHNKNRIILTHNTDLIRLLYYQYKHCFKLYLFNNTEGEVNGFIPLSMREEEILISLDKLLEAFRNDVLRYVQDQELFLISMIPFMRGYANIINRRDIYENLTQVMHGYKVETVDIAQAYRDLFHQEEEALPSYVISVSHILEKTVDGVSILDTNVFPLLNRTLTHSFIYLSLRLAIEKALVDKYNLNTTNNPQLGQIISAAYPMEDDIEQIRARVHLASKKTLINEFNHFEGNLSIFQPAIDITDSALEKEQTDIINFIEDL